MRPVVKTLTFVVSCGLISVWLWANPCARGNHCQQSSTILEHDEVIGILVNADGAKLAAHPMVREIKCLVVDGKGVVKELWGVGRGGKEVN